MKIVDLICTEGKTGFYYDDQCAIKSGAIQDGFTYKGKAVTDGFMNIRQPGESISVILVLEDGQIAVGDCVAVQYSGVGGRDSLFLAQHFIPLIYEKVKPVLVGRNLDDFKSLAEEIDSMEIDEKRMHTAIRYGVTQSLLKAVALSKKTTMAEVIKNEYQSGVEIKRIPIFAQSGDERYINTDKMIIKSVDVLPHALINNVKEKLGIDGSKLLEYINWLSNRIKDIRLDEGYNPILHIDVYGTIGMALGTDVKEIVNYLSRLVDAARPFKLRIEGPVDMGDRKKQMEALRDITSEIDKRGLNLEIVADEWCNTLEDIKYFADNRAGNMIQIKTPDLGGVNNIADAILYCKSKGIGAYCGGTCNETNISAECTTNIALACGASQCLAKPGMGVDEGYMIVNNEMNRVVALVNWRNK